MSGYLSLRTAQGNGSISENAMGRHPIGSHATEAASIPEKRLRYLIRPSAP